MTRLICDTIAARLLLLVAVCIAVSIGVTWLVVELSAGTTPHRMHQLAERIVGVALAIEAAPEASRDEIATRASTPDYSLRWRHAGLAPAASETGGPEPPDDDDELLREALARATGKPPSSLWISHPTSDVLGLPFNDGSTLQVTASPAVSFRPTAMGALWLALISTSALLVCLLAARKVAQGMARFAETADHFGRAATVQSLPERGPREVRAAIAAFNAMQARIERVMAERSAMLGALSHDLRTPLARLRLRAEFMADPVEQARMLRDLDEMGAMVSQSLEFLRDDARAEPATRLDLAVLLQGIAEEQADLGHAVTFHGPAHATIRARPLSLKRALANIVENAVKFGSRAEIELLLDGEAAAVAVSDDGPGIPEGLRERVFEPFYRAEASRNRETGGVGLGLSIARTVVRAHGGEIRLADHALGGLVVHVELPMVAAV